MKKILLSCSLALGIFATAQFSQNFDAATTVPAGWTVINGGDPNGFTFGIPTTSAGVPAAHSGANVARIAFNAAAHDDYLVTPAITVVAGVNDRISFWVASYSSAYLENYNVMLSTTTPTAEAFTTTLKATSKAPNAWTKVSLDLTPYVGQTVYVGLHAVDTDQFHLYFDTVVNDTAPTTIPACTSLSSPANGATAVSVRPNFTWSNSELADGGYKLTVGTTTGASDVINVNLPASTTSYIAPTSLTPLQANTTYYAKVVAYNGVGDAENCVETTFTTGANPLQPYCGPMATNAPTQLAPITSVIFAGETKTSDETAATVGVFDLNQAFLNPSFSVKNNVTSVPLTIEGIALGGGNGWAMSVFVDWNDDGDFVDAGESYFNTTATMKRTTVVSATNKATLTGNITIPAGTTFGVKRMRIKYNFSGTTINLPLTTACTDMSNGQVEDYTINYEEFLAVGNNTKTSLSVFPNPFQDVLKISDIKGVKSISISDVSGRQVKNMKPAAELNLSDLKTGMYIVTLNMEDGTVRSFKTIKK